MVEGGRFEIYCRATYRGFESRPLRHIQPSTFFGEMTEWTKVLAWNASVGQPTVGSNPTLSAILAPLCAAQGGGRVLVVGDP